MHVRLPQLRDSVDPVTGDRLTPGEYVSWLIQGIIRRWVFLILMTVVTVLVWAVGNDTARSWWNYGASYLALVIESLVGIAMFGQTRRDAVVLREVRAISRRVEQMAGPLVKDMGAIEEQLEEQKPSQPSQPSKASHTSRPSQPSKASHTSRPSRPSKTSKSAPIQRSGPSGRHPEKVA